MKMSNIVEITKLRFSNEIIEMAASKLNEKASNIKKSIDASISILFLALLLKTEQKNLKNILLAEQKQFKINEIDFQTSTIFEVELSNPNKGIVGAYGSLLPLLFDDQTDTLIDKLSGYSKIKSVSGHHILTATTALILSLLNKNYVLAKEAGVGSLLLHQKQNILNNLPVDALFYKIFDFSGIKEFQEKSNLKRKIYEKAIPPKYNYSIKQKILYFLLLLLLLNLIWVVFIKGK